MGTLLADGIAPEGILILGAVYFLLPAAAVIVLEGAILWLLLRLPFRVALRWSLAANLLSALAGIPVFYLFYSQFERFVPSDLNLYFAAYLRFSLIRYLAYFVLSVVVEGAWGFHKNRALPHPLSRARIVAAFIVANIASYAALCPVHYLATGPRHTFARLTADTSWCADGSTPILFLNASTAFLMQTTPRGGPVKTLVPQAMEQFQLSPDRKTCLYWRDGKLRHWRGGKVTDIADLKADASRLSIMTTVTLSPSGNHVAYSEPVKRKDGLWPEACTLYIQDVATGKRIAAHPNLDTSEPPTLAWSKREDELFIYAGPKPQRVRLEGDIVTMSDIPNPETIVLSDGVGTFGKTLSMHPQLLAEDDAADRHVYAAAWNILSNEFFAVTRDKPWREAGQHDYIVRLSDNPGIVFLSHHRRYGDVAFVPESSLVVLTDETFGMLYLVDPETRTIGKLGPGRSPVVASNKYRIARFFPPSTP